MIFTKLASISLVILLLASAFTSSLSLLTSVQKQAFALPDQDVFDATGNVKFDISDNTVLRTTAFSLAAWFKTSKDYSAENGFIANKGGFGTTSSGSNEASGGNLNYGLWIEKSSNGQSNANKLAGGFETSSGTNYFIISPSTLNDNNWHYAVVTFQAKTLTLYVDGSPVGVKNNIKSLPDVGGNKPLRIAADSQYVASPTKPMYFTGSIDDVMLWNRALSASEISGQFNSGQYVVNGLIVHMNGIDANYPPISNAGPDATVTEGTAGVTLDGTASSDLDGNNSIVSYKWEQISGSPTVSINSPSSVITTFDAPLVTSTSNLTFRLNVTDNHGYSNLDNVVITVQNANGLPTANAGADQTVDEGTLVTLDGTSSSDPDGTITVYQWAQFSGSPSVSLSGAATSVATFTAPDVTANTNLVFRLTVTDNDGASITDDIQITINKINQNPVANAGTDQTVHPADQVTLNGGASSDPDGDNLTYSWLQTVGQTVSITNPNSASASFTAPQISGNTETLTFQLTVTDTENAQSTDTVDVTVSILNIPPVANAGQDQSKTEGTLVTLDGSGSSDPDNAPSSLTYLWEQIGTPTVSLSSTTVAQPTFTAPQVSSDTSLQFKLTVSDGATSSSDTVNILVTNVVVDPYHYSPFLSTNGNYKDVADSDPLKLTTFSLAAWFKTDASSNDNGFIVNRGGFATTTSGSKDETQGKNLNYGLWIEKSSNAQFPNRLGGGFETSCQSCSNNRWVYSNTALNDGQWHYAVVTYNGATVRLYVDGVQQTNTLSTTDIPDVFGTNKPVRMGANSAFVTGGNIKPMYFNGQIDEVRLWNRAISATEVSDQYNSAIINTNGLVVYMDGVNTSPLARAGADQSVAINTLVTLDGSTSYDPDNNPLTYSWTQTLGPQVTLTNPNSAIASFTSPNVASTTNLEFSLTVSDSQYSSTDKVMITVTNTVGGYHFSPSYALGGKQYFEIIDKEAELRLQTFSIATWFKTSVTPTKNAYLVSKGTSDTTINYGIWLDTAGKVRAGFKASSSTVSLASSSAKTDNTWHYAVLTCDRPTNSMKLYVDGSLAGSTGCNSLVSTSTAFARVGASGTTGNPDDNFFRGEIDELRIWSKALTLSEIQEQYLSGIYSQQSANLVYFTGMDDVPKASTGGLQIVAGGSQATLNGTTSSDPNNDSLTYLWSGPSGAVITDGDKALASAIVPSPASGNGEKAFFPSTSPSSSPCPCFLLKVSDSKYAAADIAQIVSYDPTSSSTILKTPQHALASEPKYKDDLIASIGTAENHVYVSMYYVCVDSCSGTSTYDNAVINALQARIQQVPSLNVRLIFPEQTMQQYPAFISELESKGFVNATLNTSCSGLCYKVKSTHAKVVEIDDKVAYVGSANWNDMGLDNNWELTLKSTNPNMIKDAKNYVLWNWGSGTRPNNPYLYERFVSGLQYNNLLLDSLKNAKSVKALMFEITSHPTQPTSPDTQVISELKNAYLRGTDLQLLWDDPRYCLNTDGRDAQNFLYNNDILSRIDLPNTGLSQRTHAKTVLIDDSLLFIGSHNWNTDSLGTASSPGSVLEVSIVTRNPQAIAQWQAMFDERYGEGKPAWTDKANIDDNDRQPCRDFSLSASTNSLNVPRLGGTQTNTVTTTSGTSKTATVDGITVTTTGAAAGTITIQQTLNLGTSSGISNIGTVTKSGTGAGLTLGTVQRAITPTTSSTVKTITFTIPFTTSGAINDVSIGTLSLPFTLGTAATASIATTSGSPTAAVTSTISITTWGTKYIVCNTSGTCDDRHAVQFNVTMSASPSITGVTTSFAPAFVITHATDPGTKTTVLTVRADSSAAPGSYVLTIKGNGAIVGTVGAPRAHAITINLTVS